MRVLVGLLIAGFLILVGANPAVGENTIGLALRGAAALIAMIPPILLLAGGGWFALRRAQ
ncbi:MULTISPECIES: hypothetical protein [unclassified Streptomyces]|uniref:hypothetical protein n=1 Tax=unclassified Streptomyces TaxID=2593676 RepID=UPI0033B3A8FF